MGKIKNPTIIKQKAAERSKDEKIAQLENNKAVLEEQLATQSNTLDYILTEIIPPLMP